MAGRQAVTRFGASWPSEGVGKVRVDGGTEVEVLHKAADQEGWDGGWICQVNKQRVCIDEDALKFSNEPNDD